MPANLHASNVTATAFTLSWDASTDDVAVAGYEVFRDGASIGTPTGKSFDVAGLAAGTRYAMTVRARDAIPNWSAQSAPLQVTTTATPDTQPPTVPTGLHATAVSSSVIDLTWTASTDDVGVTGYRIYRDGGATAAATSAVTSYGDSGLAASTTYSYTVTAYDAAGNESGHSASASATTSAPPAGVREDLGMNVGTVAYWVDGGSYDFQFANQILHSTQASGTFNALGYPTGTSASLYLWADSSEMDGTYRFSCDGRATVAMSGGTVSDLQYSGGVTTATIVVSNPGKMTATLNLSGMTASPDGSITEVKLMRPVAEGSTATYDPSVTFTDQFLELVRKVAVFRTMDMTATNGNAQVAWTDRVTPAWLSQFNDGGSAWQGHGVAWEYVIELANTSGRDPWICVPHLATDDYVTQLATLFKNNLDPARKLYVEYSNELWNTAGAFSGNWNHDQAVAEQNAGVPYDFDGDTNDWDWAWRRIAKRGAEVSQIFRNVFGDAQMMTRVRPVLESQLGYNEGPLLQALAYAQGYLATLAPTPHPVSYYFYGGGGSSYYGADAGTVDAVLASLPGSGWDQAILDDVGYLAPFGLKRIAYEGGPGFDDLTAAELGAWYDPRMTDHVAAAHDVFTQNGGDLSVYFSSDGNERWRWPGMTNATYFTSPKILGIDQLNGQTPVPFSKGTLAPARLSSTSYDVPVSWLPGNGAPTDVPLNGWWGYLVRSATSRSYSIGVSAGATNANGRLKLSVDGQELGTLVIPNTGSTSTFRDSNVFSVTLGPGKHGILIQGTGGPGFNVNQIVVQ